MNLKNRLIAYKKDDWKFPENIDADILADEIKEAFADTDGILRDRLALDGFDKLITSGKVSDEKCQNIFNELVSNKYLLNGLGKECDDSVFGRAFCGYGILTLLEYSSIIGEHMRLREPISSVIERGIINEKEFADWIAAICAYEKTGNAEDDTCKIMGRCEFMVTLNNGIKDKQPHLACYAFDAIIKLMEM